MSEIEIILKKEVTGALALIGVEVFRGVGKDPILIDHWNADGEALVSLEPNVDHLIIARIIGPVGSALKLIAKWKDDSASKSSTVIRKLSITKPRHLSATGEYILFAKVGA